MNATMVANGTKAGRRVISSIRQRPRLERGLFRRRDWNQFDIRSEWASTTI